MEMCTHHMPMLSLKLATRLLTLWVFYQKWLRTWSISICRSIISYYLPWWQIASVLLSSSFWCEHLHSCTLPPFKQPVPLFSELRGNSIGRLATLAITSSPSSSSVLSAFAQVLPQPFCWTLQFEQVGLSSTDTAWLGGHIIFTITSSLESSESREKKKSRINEWQTYRKVVI